MSDPNAAIAARASASVLLLPGLWNSGPEHWHTYWERAYGFTRLIQRDWETPARTDWVATIDAAVAGAPGAVVLAGHSLAIVVVVLDEGETNVPIPGVAFVGLEAGIGAGPSRDVVLRLCCHRSSPCTPEC